MLIEGLDAMKNEILKMFDMMAPTVIRYETALEKIRDGILNPRVIAAEALKS